MRNVVGPVPTDKDFFLREPVAEQLRRAVDNGHDVYLAGPRKAGKTALLQHLKAQSSRSYDLIYVSVGSLDSSTGFFRLLLEALFQGDLVSRLSNLPSKSYEAVTKTFGAFSKVDLFGSGFEFDFKNLTVNRREETDYQNEFWALVKELDLSETTLVFMIDEFPQMVANIRNVSGDETAKAFLKRAKFIRQSLPKNIRIFYSGAIGLPNLAKAVGAEEEIDDLTVLPLPPLAQGEALRMTLEILKHYQVPYEAVAIDAMLERIGFLNPYFVQLAARELIDEHESTQSDIDAEAADRAFEKMTHIRNEHFFDPFYASLHKAFGDKDHKFALKFLKKLSQADSMDNSEIETLCKIHGVEAADLRFVIETLSHDGYITTEKDGDIETYRFAQPVLQNWWRKYVA